MFRTLALAAAVGCGSNQKSAEKQEPAPPQATPSESETKQPEAAASQAGSVSQDELLKADMVVICSAAKATGGEWFVDVGPYIAEHMKSMYKVELFAGVTTGQTTLEDIVARIRKLMAKTGVATCDTV